ncbi:hypothetical protein [Legionella fallonii]|uniref:Uncharacterized protein n=1 Tax=Legionella fallonii LLAP-10 TaxID=1212491 RepID=A0A098G518_9GAMM|nr:hypothetical protein [Legionella fallonii]CEG57578.1 conserved protein of unknown function [Legionella fallonii LLAP-10]
MPIDKFNQFLGNNCGVTKDVVDKALDGELVKITSLFFQPYRSKSDPWHRAASIVTAPVCSSILAAESALLSLLLGCKSIIDLIILDPENAKENMGNSAVFLIAAAITLFVALISPIINGINLVFGGMMTMLQTDREEYSSSLSSGY